MALTATMLTITVNEQNREGKKRRNRCSVVTASADTYPSNGIPLPTIGNFGMVNQLDYILMYDDVSGSEIVWKFSATNGNQGTLRGYTLTASDTWGELATTATIAASSTWLVEAVGY